MPARRQPCSLISRPSPLPWFEEVLRRGENNVRSIQRIEYLLRLFPHAPPSLGVLLPDPADRLLLPDFRRAQVHARDARQRGVEAGGAGRGVGPGQGEDVKGGDVRYGDEVVVAEGGGRVRGRSGGIDGEEVGLGAGGEESALEGEGRGGGCAEFDAVVGENAFQVLVDVRL